MRSLRPDQIEAVDFLSNAGRAIHGDPPGAGKTASAVCVLNKWGPERVLVVTPHLVGAGPRQWQNALVEWGPGFDSYLGIGDPETRLSCRKMVKGFGGIYITNYDCMRGEVDELLGIPWDAVVFDEAHRLSNRKSKQTKAAQRLAKRIPLLLHMTGTPVEHPDDLWSLLNMIDPKAYSSYWRWVNEYCLTEKTDFHGSIPRAVTLVYGLKPGADSRIRDEIAPVMIQRELKFVLGEDPDVTVLEVDLSPAEQRMYSSIEKKYLYIDDSGDIVMLATNEVSKLQLQRQIASDFSKYDPTGTGSKMSAAVDFVKSEMVSEKIVVACEFKHTVRTLAAKLGPAAVEYHGDLPDKIRYGNIGQFLGDPECRVIVGTIGALGEGLDGLQSVSSLMVTVDRPWTLRAYDQLVGRLYRSGQAEQVRIVHIVAKDTVDAKIAHAHVERKELREALRPTSEQSSETVAKSPI